MLKANFVHIGVHVDTFKDIVIHVKHCCMRTKRYNVLEVMYSWAVVLNEVLSADISTREIHNVCRNSRTDTKVSTWSTPSISPRCRGGRGWGSSPLLLLLLLADGIFVWFVVVRDCLQVIFVAKNESVNCFCSRKNTT